MSSTLTPKNDARAAAAQLFAKSPPVLVEVRFPGAGTSPDWYLCEEDEELDNIMKQLAPGAELYLSSVWDLQNRKGAVRLTKTSSG